FFAWLWGSFSLFLGRCVLIFCILPGIVLMAVAIPSYKNYMDKSHKARAEAEAAAAAQKDGATSAPQTDKCLPGMTTEQCNATRTNEQKGIPADQAASS
ncbi:MAG: hypothetical protein AB7V34_07335, partial [Brachymonas sp.]